jgi:predicted tellurium resistance membrane protein TerC
MKEASFLSKFLSNFMQVLNVLVPMLLFIVVFFGLVLLLVLLLKNNVPYWLSVTLMPLGIAAIIAFMYTGIEEIERRLRGENK